MKRDRLPYWVDGLVKHFQSREASANTPHRTRTIKTGLTEAEHADFMERLTAYGMSQSEFIRQAITDATITPRGTTYKTGGK